ncbi:hypothetical protein JOB18_022991 [Solea senegalensis]|uniref:Uncharacterized protein n=1 Tax=Solea senegalensis TaxID=28829 RepID=A0AAV6R5V6_SOLSE|nr:hypothetical protein JOB18_022991 [Solea senegalensis]
MAKKYSVEDALKMIMDPSIIIFRASSTLYFFSSDFEQLGEDDEDEEDEEWTPTARIGENPDSSDDEE